MLYTVDEKQRKFFPFKDKEWAEYIVYNRVIRTEKHTHNYKWTFGSLADGKFVGLLCKQYFKNEINVDNLINGYIDGQDTIKGISPYSDDYDQLSFHEDEEFVNTILKYQSFEIIAQQAITQERR